ncbi:hypothetical protein BJV82DRAFT_556856 [Fennellomyces sp. T-0311]|nr:hypothetical protein BJV82DRAFT_556856 [Fennellomyces sp. T-0311]
MFNNRFLRRALAIIVPLAALVAIIIPTWKIYSKEGRASTLISYSAPNMHGESLYISATVIDVDFSEKTYRLHCMIRANGTLANEYGQLSRPILVSFSSLSSYHIGAGDDDNPLNVVFSYHNGDEIDYPFDRYTGAFEVYASYANDTDHRIPITFHLSASLTSFAFNPTLVDPEPNETDRVGLKIDTGRSTTTLGFSIFICILMWALSLVLTVFAFQVIVRNRRVDAHACMIGISMLFALPALRSAQPGAPAIGCTSDILSFYWNMAIIAINSLSVIVCWVVRWSGCDPIDSSCSSLNSNKEAQHIERVV